MWRPKVKLNCFLLLVTLAVYLTYYTITVKNVSNFPAISTNRLSFSKDIPYTVLKVPSVNVTQVLVKPLPVNLPPVKPPSVKPPSVKPPPVLPAAKIHQQTYSSTAFDYVLNPDSSCSASESEVKLLIGVHSSRSEFGLRQTVRETWSRDARYYSIVVLFFIGKEERTEPSEIGVRLRKEFETFNDIVEEDYVDCYRNLTLKSLSILKWVNLYCRKTQFVMKTDTDVYVHIPNVIKSLAAMISNNRTTTHNNNINERREDSNSNLSPPLIAGFLRTNIPPVRDVARKWYTTLDEFPSATYPSYVYGAAYVMTSSAARLLYDVSLDMPFVFWLEDVFVTGIVAAKAGVRHVHDAGYLAEKVDTTACSFKFKAKPRTAIATSHGFNSSEMEKIYREFHNSTFMCA